MMTNITVPLAEVYDISDEPYSGKKLDDQPPGTIIATDEVGIWIRDLSNMSCTDLAIIEDFKRVTIMVPKVTNGVFLDPTYIAYILQEVLIKRGAANNLTHGISHEIRNTALVIPPAKEQKSLARILAGSSFLEEKKKYWLGRASQFWQQLKKRKYNHK